MSASIFCVLLFILVSICVLSISKRDEGLSMLLYNVQLQGNNLPLKVYIVSNLVREAVFDHVEPAIRHLEAFPCRKKKMMIGSQVQ